MSQTAVVLAVLLRCDKCGICIHMYCCNCADALIHHTICKHIHLVATTMNTKQSKHYHSEEDLNNVNTDNVLISTLQSDGQCDLSQLKQKVMRRLSALTTQIHLCNSIPALSAIDSHLVSACNAAKIIDTSETSNKSKAFSTSTNNPANKKITPQRPFYSTKSKTKRPTIRLAKPTQKEKEDLCTLLNLDNLYTNHCQVTNTNPTVTNEEKSEFACVT